MYKVAMTFLIIFTWLFIDWHSRFVFVARGYPRRYGHGKSWLRAHKHYKNNWSFFERIFWCPVFKERYSRKYRMLAYLAYIHTFFAFITVGFFFFSIEMALDSKIWIYEFIAYEIFSFLRYIYSNALGREK